MNEREERISLEPTGRKNFLGGANCAESIWQAFSEGLDQDEQALGNCLASGFGGAWFRRPLGLLRGIMVLGLHYGRIPGKPRNEMLKELCQKFYEQAKEELGSVYCRDLRDPEDENYREKCAEIVAKMAALIEKILEEGKENS